MYKHKLFLLMTVFHQENKIFKTVSFKLNSETFVYPHMTTFVYAHMTTCLCPYDNISVHLSCPCIRYMYQYFGCYYFHIFIYFTSSVPVHLQCSVYLHRIHHFWTNDCQKTDRLHSQTSTYTSHKKKRHMWTF